MDESFVAMKEMPSMHSVSRVIQEAHSIRTIFINGKIESKPGQFIMVWLPGIEEKPMAVSYLSSSEFGFTYHTIGKFTKACDNLKKGSTIGIRGPYGNPFSIRKNALVVGGGVGMASVSTLIDALENPVVINGARNKGSLIYMERFSGMIVTTDDGSFGRKGFVTEPLEDELSNKKFSIVYTCGPELMMKKVFEICEKHKVDCEASLERVMKCGFGICGNCLVDGHILCTEGPVFGSKILRNLKEFGNSARLKTGKKASLKEYYGWRS
ncbi:dihydroorotate dehydrogenase electron transfer subunit [Candidatus Woesearchaeota archaeon]|nr:dihydroorotate dehydrogenase electron transfer subunit [Candidatus Woesearchaeota archaeon]